MCFNHALRELNENNTRTHLKTSLTRLCHHSIVYKNKPKNDVKSHISTDRKEEKQRTIVLQSRVITLGDAQETQSWEIQKIL